MFQSEIQINESTHIVVCETNQWKLLICSLPWLVSLIGTTMLVLFSDLFWNDCCSGTKIWVLFFVLSWNHMWVVFPDLFQRTTIWVLSLISDLFRNKNVSVSPDYFHWFVQEQEYEYVLLILFRNKNVSVFPKLFFWFVPLGVFFSLISFTELSRNNYVSAFPWLASLICSGTPVFLYLIIFIELFRNNSVGSFLWLVL